MSSLDDVTFECSRKHAVAITLAECNAECKKFIERMHSQLQSEKVLLYDEVLPKNMIDHELDQLTTVRFLNNHLNATSNILDIRIKSVEFQYETYKQSYKWPRMIYIIRIAREESYLPQQCFIKKALRHVIFQNESELSSIGYKCFAMCRHLISINLPNNLLSIGEYAFQHCINLQHVKIPKKLKYMEQGLFDGCVALPNKILIPSNVFKVGRLVFNECTSIKTVCIVSPIISIDETAFNSCNNLKVIEVSKQTRCIFVTSDAANSYIKKKQSDIK